MIKGYKEIALIYSQTTKELALYISKRIDEYQEIHGYPIKPVMCFEETIERNAQGNLTATLEHMFKNVDYALVLLGEEELVIKKRSMDVVMENLFSNGKELISKEEFSNFLNAQRIHTSQNVILELGYFWNKLGTQRISFITLFPYDKFSENYDFPSDWSKDLFSSIDMNSNEDYKFKIDGIIENALKKLKVYFHFNYLDDIDYNIDYSKLFLPDELARIEGYRSNLEQYQEIVSIWKSEINSLHRNDERLIYIYERLVFYSYFPKDSTLANDWFIYSVNCIRRSELKEDELPYYELIMTIKRYIECRNANSTDEEYGYYSYIRIVEKLEEILGKIKNRKSNIIILKNLYDYLGLAYRVIYEEAKKEQDKLEDDEKEKIKLNKEWVVNSVQALNELISLEESTSNDAMNLWLGYSVFNRARSLKLLSDIDISHELLSRYQWDEDLKNACSKRKSWLNAKMMANIPTVFELSLKAEYIHAELYRIKACRKNSNDYDKKKFIELRTIYEDILKRSTEKINLIEWLADLLKKTGNELGLE